MKTSYWHLPLIVVVAFWLASCGSHHKIQKSTVSTPPVKERHDAEPSSNSASEKSLHSKYAGILGVSPGNITNDKLYAFINDWYGVPYKYAGKDKQGIDCSGFAMKLYSDVYHKVLSPSAKIQAEETKNIDTSDLKEGDLVFFDINAGKISHVGVYLQNNKFVHASTHKGVVINDLNEPYYKKYYIRSGRLK